MFTVIPLLFIAHASHMEHNVAGPFASVDDVQVIACIVSTKQFVNVLDSALRSTLDWIRGNHFKEVLLAEPVFERTGAKGNFYFQVSIPSARALVLRYYWCTRPD